MVPMAAGEEKTGDFYAVLGLKKECSDGELRNAYKKLAMRWHPDKCSSSRNAERLQEAKEKFQEVQKAYSVLSDSNRRFLYDVGVYDNDDHDDENGMGDFLREMVQMMSQNKSSENGEESFEDLQRLFVELFQDDLGGGFGGPARGPGGATSGSPFANGGAAGGHKRGNSAMASNKSKLDELDPAAAGFCFGLGEGGGQSSRGGTKGGMSGNSKRRHGRKQRVSSKHDVSSCDSQVPF